MDWNFLYGPECTVHQKKKKKGQIFFTEKCMKTHFGHIIVMCSNHNQNTLHPGMQASKADTLIIISVIKFNAQHIVKNNLCEAILKFIQKKSDDYLVSLKMFCFNFKCLLFFTTLTQHTQTESFEKLNISAVRNQTLNKGNIFFLFVL